MIVALAVFAVYGYRLARNNWAHTFNTPPISYGWVTLSLPVCSVMMILTSVTKILKLVKNFNDDAYNVRKDNPPCGDALEEPAAVADAMTTEQPQAQA